MSDRFGWQKDCVRRALDQLDGIALNVGCCTDQSEWPVNSLKPIDPARVINCDLSAVDELYQDPDDETRVTGTRPNAAEVLFDAAADRWPFEDGAACLVVLGDILEHMDVDDIVSTLREARRVSQRVCITVPEDTRPGNSPERADRFRRGHVHRTIVSERLLRNALKQSGWRIIRFTPVGDYDESLKFWGQQVMGYYVEAERGDEGEWQARQQAELDAEADRVAERQSLEEMQRRELDAAA